MQKYILYGDPNEVAKVIQENRLRVERGSIKLEPVQPGTVDSDSIDAKDEQITKLANAVNQLTESHGALNQLAGDLVAIIVTSGQDIPDDMAARLDYFGVYVPEIAENDPENAEKVENETENVPEIAENVPEPMEDSKAVEVEDMTEVDLDDVKDAPEEDTKDAPAPTPKKTRTKKAQ